LLNKSVFQIVEKCAAPMKVVVKKMKVGGQEMAVMVVDGDFFKLQAEFPTG